MSTGVQSLEIKNLFTANKEMTEFTRGSLYVFWVFFGITLISILAKGTVIPSPLEVIRAWWEVFNDQNLIGELGMSVLLFSEASFIALLISLSLAYLSVIPFFRPLIDIISKFRYFSLYGFSLIFILMSVGAMTLKVELLVFGMTGYLVTSYAEMVRSVTRDDIEYAKTLRLTNGQIVWHVIIQGKRFDVVELFRQNVAIIWMMLSTVEGYAMDAGGLGTMMLRQYRMSSYAKIFATQLTIFAIGILLDYILRKFSRVVAPHIVYEERRA